MSNLTRGTVRDSLSVAITVVAYGGAAASAIAAATMLGTRNALYGIQMAPQLKVKGARRVLAAHITIDESTGVALSQAPRGVAAMPAAFLGLLWPRLQTNFLRGVAVTSMVFAMLVTPWLTAGLPIIATTLVAVVLGWRAR